MDVFFKLIFVFFALGSAHAGSCWFSVGKKDRCTALVQDNVDHESCCSSNDVSAAYSAQDLDSGDLFFWRVLGGGVPCTPCRVTCDGVQCGEGKKCVIRNGAPKCVCSPDCKALLNGSKGGPVCGSDGRSYKSACRLKKRACREKQSNLYVAYNGPCQNSCDKITCPSGKYCLLDQNLTPHCVKCSRRCIDSDEERAVCGTDGVTYPSSCYLKEAACKSGKAIPIAYRGHCFNGANCRNIECKEGQVCLTDPKKGGPRCVTCSYRCPNAKSQRELGGPICGTNNRTYISWCHMLKDSCSTGFVIETKFPGTCQAGGITKTNVWNYQHQNKFKNKKQTNSPKESHKIKDTKALLISSSNKMNDQRLVLN